MEQEQYLLVAADVLPEVFLRVLEAKELLAAGKAKNVSHATKMVDVSRSAFYKYKDSVFRANVGQEMITLKATLKDETGALQSLLAGISETGAGIVTINQSMPENGMAKVEVSVHMKGTELEVTELCNKLQEQPTVLEIKARSKG